MSCKNYKLLYCPGPVSRGEAALQALGDQCSCMRARGLCGLHLPESSCVQLGAKASVRHSEWMPFMSCREHACWGTWSLYTVLVPPVKAFSQEDSCAFLTAFNFTPSQNTLFSISICGVATHHLCCKPDSEHAVELGAYICVLNLLFLSPQSSFSLVQHSLPSFLLRKGKTLQPWHPWVEGESTGTHTVKKIKDRRKETERDRMFMY